MSENRRARESSSEIRASLVDSGWSEPPGSPSDAPPSSRPDVKTRQISAEELAELVRSAEGAPIDPAEPRDLPRYDAPSATSDEPERILDDLVPPEEMTKRIPYARLLGGSQAGHGGPKSPAAPPPPPFPVSDDASKPLPSFARSDSHPDGAPAARGPMDSEPLPAFGAAHPTPVVEANLDAASSVFDDPTVVQRIDPPRVSSRPPPPPPRASSPPPPAPPQPPRESSPPSAPQARGSTPPPPAPQVRASTPPPPELQARESSRPPPPPEPAAVAVEPKSPVAPQAVLHGSTEFELATAVEAERGMLGALAQRYRFLGLRLPVWTLLPISAAAVALPMYFWPKAPATPPSVAPVVSAAPPASQVKPEPETKAEEQGVHAEAARGEIEAIERLKQRPETERSIEDAMALARGESAQRLKALEPLAARLKQEPAALEDAEFRREFLEFVTDRGTYMEALAALAQVPSSLAADLLYEIWTGTKKSNEVTRLAKDLVYTKDVRSRASDALAVALDLRDAESCQDNQSAVRRALDYGDRRSFHLLGRLLSTRGCGPDKADDCYPCLRDTDRVQQALEAVRSRKPPVL